MRLQFLWLSVISSFVFTSPPLFAQEDCYLKAIDWIRQDTLVRRLVTTYLRVDGVTFAKRLPFSVSDTLVPIGGWPQFDDSCTIVNKTGSQRFDDAQRGSVCRRQMPIRADSERSLEYF